MTTDDALAAINAWQRQYPEPTWLVIGTFPTGVVAAIETSQHTLLMQSPLAHTYHTALTNLATFLQSGAFLEEQSA